MNTSSSPARIVNSKSTLELCSAPAKLPVAESPVQSGASPIIASREAGRRLTVPATIESNIEFKVSPNFYVIGRVEVEMDPPRIRQSRQKTCRESKVCAVELE